MAYSDTYGGYAAAAAFTAGVPPDLFLAQIQQESGFDPNAYNPAGSTATGIGQFTPGTAAAMGLNPNDPYASLDAAAQLDAQNYDASGTWLGGVTMYGTLPSSGNYNAGQQNVANIAGSYDTGWLGGNESGSIYDPMTGFQYNSTTGAVVGPGGTSTQTSVAPGVGSGYGTVGTGIGSSLSTIASFFSGLTSGAIWQRFGLFFIGAIFLVGALFLTKSGQQVLQTAVKTAR